MADNAADSVTMNQVIGVAVGIVSTVMATGGSLLAYLLRKRDERIEQHERDIIVVNRRVDDTEKEALRQQVKISETYATKDSMRLLFQESQQTQRDMSARLEKQIDETKSEIKDTKNKIDTMQTAIMSELSKKT